MVEAYASLSFGFEGSKSMNFASCSDFS